MVAGNHTYLRTHRLAGRVIVFDTATEEAKIRQQAAASKTGRAAKTLVKEGQLRVTLIGLRKGSALGAHQVEGELSIHVLRGALGIRGGGSDLRVPKGGIAVMHAGVRHDARALRDTVILLTTSMR
jgi:quercetin dioxygenase-like cupin family protein